VKRTLTLLVVNRTDSVAVSRSTPAQKQLSFVDAAGEDGHRSWDENEEGSVSDRQNHAAFASSYNTQPESPLIEGLILITDSV